MNEQARKIPRLTAKVGADCRAGAHGWCSGRVWSQIDRHGQNVYSRCQCPCHKSASLPVSCEGSHEGQPAGRDSWTDT